MMPCWQCGKEFSWKEMAFVRLNLPRLRGLRVSSYEAAMIYTNVGRKAFCKSCNEDRLQADNLCDENRHVYLTSAILVAMGLL